MKNLVLLIVFVLMNVVFVNAQKVFTKTGHISFYSDTPMEKIEGHNKSSTCVLDLATGNLEYGALIKGFQFEKALMQEHFNENYMESTKFPKAIFKGKIDDYKLIDLTKNGKTNVKVSGKLTIHGVTKDVTTNGIITVNSGKVDADAEFNVMVADYNISIPSLVKDQIARSVKVKVDVTLEALK